MNESRQDKVVTLLTVLEVARLLGRSTSSVKRLADEMRLDIVRTGNGQRLFRPEDHVEKMRTEIQRRDLQGVRR